MTYRNSTPPPTVATPEPQLRVPATGTSASALGMCIMLGTVATSFIWLAFAGC